MLLEKSSGARFEVGGLRGVASGGYCVRACVCVHKCYVRGCIRVRTCVRAHVLGVRVYARACACVLTRVPWIRTGLGAAMFKKTESEICLGLCVRVRVYMWCVCVCAHWGTTHPMRQRAPNWTRLRVCGSQQAVGCPWLYSLWCGWRSWTPHPIVAPLNLGPES